MGWVITAPDSTFFSDITLASGAAIVWVASNGQKFRITVDDEGNVVSTPIS